VRESMYLFNKNPLGLVRYIFIPLTRKNPRDLENGHEYLKGLYVRQRNIKKLFAVDLPYSCLLQRGGQAVFCPGCSGSYRPASQCRLYGTFAILSASLVFALCHLPFASL
jgi:hypothetical protein